MWKYTLSSLSKNHYLVTYIFSPFSSSCICLYLIGFSLKQKKIRIINNKYGRIVKLAHLKKWPNSTFFLSLSNISIHLFWIICSNSNSLFLLYHMFSVHLMFVHSAISIENRPLRNCQLELRLNNCTQRINKIYPHGITGLWRIREQSQITLHMLYSSHEMLYHSCHVSGIKMHSRIIL